MAGAVAVARAGELGARFLCWRLPAGGAEAAGGIVEGTLLGAYRFTRYKGGDDEDDAGRVERLVVSAGEDLSEPVSRAVVVAEAQNAARDLQNTPANDMTPTRLGERARELADSLDGLTVEVEGREAIETRGMGAFAAVAKGSYEEPALITLRYEGPSTSGPTLGLVGKAVTFDTGGISIKPSAKMAEMKFDMSGGAAVIEAMGAIARLRLPAKVVAVVGATENMPSGRSVKPGDIVRAMNGTTIEVNNTDAEGRLVLADCLGWAIEQGAERLVDLATLTGAIVVALGSTYAGLFVGRRRLGRGRRGGVAGERRAGLALPLPRGVRQGDRGPLRRHHQRPGGAQGVLDRGGRIPEALHRRRSLGSHRHRGHLLGRGAPLYGQGRQRLRRAPARRARAPRLRRGRGPARALTTRGSNDSIEGGCERSGNPTTSEHPD